MKLGSSKDKKDDKKAKDDKAPKSPKTGLFGKDKKIKRQIDYPKSAYDMAADVLPERMAKQRGRQADSKKILLILVVAIIALGGIGFGLKTAHLLDGMGIPYLSNDSTVTSEQLDIPSGKTPISSSTDAAKKAASAEKAHTDAVNKTQQAAN
jgi:hypothetical protein